LFSSGGLYTTETLIHAVGPGLGLLILALVPLVWSVPEALIVGELASMLPQEGGYYRWVDRGFGRFWAFQNGWLTWVYSLVDMAIYPVLPAVIGTAVAIVAGPLMYRLAHRRRTS